MTRTTYTFLYFCVAHYIPVKRNIKTKFPYFLLWTCMSEIRNREFCLYICFFAAFFFLLCLFFSKPSTNKKSENFSFLYLLLCGFFFFAFPSLLHSSNSSILCQLHAAELRIQALNCIWRACYCTTSMLEKQSIQHYPETTTTMMEQQKSNRADGTWGRSTGMNEKYSDPRPFHTRFGNWHIWVADTAKMCTYTARWRTYTVDSVAYREIAWVSVICRQTVYRNRT